MERIQSAIEKARARRAAADVAPEHAPAQDAAKAAGAPAPVRGAQPERRPEAQPDAATALRDTWLALDEFRPDPRVMRRSRVLTFEGGHAAAGFDMLRTRVLQQMAANGWRRLAITSPNSDCGKTTITANLAFSLARQPDLRTVVIEAEMRRPSLAGVLGLDRDKRQISEVLAGTGDLRDHLVRCGVNLAFGTNHRAVRHSSELLQGEPVGVALDSIERQLDPTLTIFDMPPMLVCDDMQAFARRVDCVLLVAAAESTTVAEIDSCERDLAEQTNVLGVVLNKCRYTEGGYGYYD